MPELPDVEVFKRYLDDTSLGRTIEAVTVNDARILKGVSARDLAARLEGNRFEASRRHGKHLLVELARNGWLALHFGMTGNLAYFEDDSEDPPYDRVRFDFTEGHLAYVNRRMLGRVGITDDADAFIEEEGLGPDALDAKFDFDAFRQALAGKRRDVKSALMDQGTIAGIGNIYADEILFHARLDPRIKVNELSDKQLETLYEHMRDVLAQAIELGAGSEQFTENLPESFLLPHREEGAKCPRCGGRIEKFKSGGRSGYFCSRCQRDG